MGNCRYCGESAGILRSAHKACEAQFNGDSELISGAFEKCCKEGAQEQALLNAIQEISANCGFPPHVARELICKGWEHCVDSALADGLATVDEESYLARVRDHFALTQVELDHNHALSRLAQAAVLRDVTNGVIVTRVKVTGHPFNFQPAETILWYFNDVKYYKIRTTRRYTGASSGLSIRIAKGVYYRPSVYTGRRVDTNTLEQLDLGGFAITNKHLYFGGKTKIFKISYRTILAIEPFSDGIGIQRTAANAKPEYFQCGDGWFVHNLVTDLAAFAS